MSKPVAPASPGMHSVPVPTPPAYWTCTMCGNRWNAHDEPHLLCNHSDAEWETWRKQQGFADGKPYARFKLDDPQPPPLEQPQPSGKASK